MGGKQIRILVIDDEEMVTRILKDFLEDQGFTVTTRARGRESLDLVRAESFDIAIVDMRLPDMDGERFIIKCNEIRPGIRYFIHTGSLDYHLSDELKGIGMTDSSVLYKPVPDMNLIVRSILDALKV
ncbi:MAG TPA: response regulator [Spirochaetota bacterium]|nr:response regulator [Spirochaetota bacterium]HRZ27947.1 response regulator [Spirochaetota bacterium]HSA13176.1 response regulator [Spirochaetota bacterium]